MFIFKVVKNMLQIKAIDIGKVEIDGRTALHLAAEGGNHDIIHDLAGRGAGVNATDYGGNTPLHRASGKGNNGAIKKLLELGSDCNIKEIRLEQTPLHYAAMAGDSVGILLLLQSKADVNSVDQRGRTAIHLATENGKTEAVKVLMEKGAEVNLVDKEDMAPIHLAAKDGQVEATMVLLKYGANVNSRSNYEMTPLHFAANNAHTELIKVLVSNGADVNSTANEQLTPLHLSADMGHAESAKVLIEKGAKINSASSEGMAPIHVAASNGHTKLLKLLVMKGAEVNQRANHDLTPLHLAANNGHTEAIMVLLEKQAEVNAKTIKEKAPLHLAAKNGYPEAVKALLENGADINLTAEFEWTSIHYSSFKGHTKCIKVLVQNGANVNAKIITGITSLHLAARNGHAEAIKILLENGADIQEIRLAASLGDYSCFTTLWKEYKSPQSCSAGQDDSQCTCLVCIFHALVERTDKMESRFKIVEVIMADVSEIGAWKALDNNGYSMLTHACQYQCVEIVQLILEKEIGRKMLKSGTPPPLWIAANNGHIGVLKILLEHKDDIDCHCKAPDGTTPLMMVITKNNRRAFDILKGFYSDNEILRRMVEFGKNELLMTRKLPPELSLLAVQSGNIGVVKMISSHEEADLKTLDLHNLAILRYLQGHDTDLPPLQSVITKLSKMFPFYNEKVEMVKTINNQIKKETWLEPRLCLDSLKTLDLGSFCCVDEARRRIWEKRYSNNYLQYAGKPVRY